jgi:hypothetical protein
MRFFYSLAPDTNSIIWVYNSSKLPIIFFDVLFILCVASPVNISLWAHLSVAVALWMLYLGQNYTWCGWNAAKNAFGGTNYTHENTNLGHNFKSTNENYDSIPKPPYHSGVVTYV